MKTDLIFALDVGGTYIKACVLEKNSIIEDTVSQFDSRSNEESDKILDHFVSILHSLSESYKNYKEEETYVFNQKKIGVGLAFPGPFDYENGISYIKGLNKFEALYGMSFRNELTKRLEQTEIFQGAHEVSIRFENDGRLFGIGGSTLYPNERIITLTIGTGLGSVFIENGKIVKNDNRIPDGGYLYNQIFKGKTVDDQFSRRGILQLAADQYILDEAMDVKELADIAKNGNKMAKALFEEFGSNLGDMLTPFIEKFHPHRIIIGGQIAKSFDLFGKSISDKVSHTQTKVSSLEHALRFTYIGIAQMFVE